MDFLTIDYQAMRNAAKQITIDDLQRYPGPVSRATVEKNPLKYTFRSLASALNQRSQEAQDRASERRKEARESSLVRKPTVESAPSSADDAAQANPGPR